MSIMFLLPVMLFLLSGGLAEVVQDFSRCNKFFRNGISPKVLPGDQYRKICQTLNNTAHYATLYNTAKKIPVYSAYVFTGKITCKRLPKWYIEPQIDNNNTDPNMNKETFVSNYQASNQDYDSSTNLFDRGHLAPVSQANSQGCSNATFTLTNAAPQYNSFNRGQWKVIENKMIATMTSYCKKSSAFVVTGVVPGDGNINNRVNVPGYFWTAYCCLNSKDEQLISGGAIGVNSEKNPTPLLKSVPDLESNLAQQYGDLSFVLFDNNCRFAHYVPVGSVMGEPLADSLADSSGVAKVSACPDFSFAILLLLVFCNFIGLLI